MLELIFANFTGSKYTLILGFDNAK